MTIRILVVEDAVASGPREGDLAYYASAVPALEHARLESFKITDSYAKLENGTRLYLYTVDVPDESELLHVVFAYPREVIGRLNLVAGYHPQLVRMFGGAFVNEALIPMDTGVYVPMVNDNPAVFATLHHGPNFNLGETQ